MKAIAYTAALLGLESVPVIIQATLTAAPGLTIAGLSESAMRESRVRVAAALAGLVASLQCRPLDGRGISVEISGAHTSGAGFDLAIACAALAALGEIPEGALSDTLLLGELSLGGDIRPIRGILAHLRGDAHLHRVVPAENRNQAGLTPLDVRFARTLGEVVGWYTGKGAELPFASPPELGAHNVREYPAAIAQQADQIIATGKRRVLLVGCPGSGRTLTARAIASRLAPMTSGETRATVEIFSAAGILQDTETHTWAARPFRAPHHSCSEAGLVGGGTTPRPGEITLAHHGVLFLDEIGEFRASALDAVFHALDRGRVLLAASRQTVSFPAVPALVIGAINPCACGYAGHARLPCRCPPASRERYAARMAKIAKNFDLTLEIQPQTVAQIMKVDH